MPPKVDLTYLDGKSQWHIKSPCDLCVRIKRPPVNKVAQRPTTVSLGSISSIRIVNKGKNYTCIALSIQTGQWAFILYPEHWYVNTSGPLFSLPDVVCCMDPSKSSTNSLQTKPAPWSTAILLTVGSSTRTSGISLVGFCFINKIIFIFHTSNRTQSFHYSQKKLKFFKTILLIK